MRVDVRLLPVKAHYFFFMAAAGAMLPFLPVLAKGLGVSAAALGIITALLPVAVLAAKPAFGALADRFPAHRRAIFLCAVVGQAAALSSLALLPALASPIPVVTEGLTNGTNLFETPSLSEPDLYHSVSFWGFVTLMAVGNVCFNVANSLSDAICFEMLGEGRELQYGRQRVWGCLGWGGAALASGACMTYVPGRLESPALLCLVFGVLDTLSCCWLRLPERKASGTMLADLWRLAHQRPALLFLGFAALVGVLDGFLIYYLLWYLEDLQTMPSENLKLLEGLVVAAQTLGGEVVFFPLSGWFLKHLGHAHCLTLVFAAYALRLALLSVVPGPWWMLPIELVLQGPTYALGYSTIVAYASAVAPSGTQATVQGIAAGVDDSLGYSLGSLLGGQLYRELGGRGAFQGASVLALCCCVSHLILHETLKSSRRLRLNHAPETVELRPAPG